MAGSATLFTPTPAGGASNNDRANLGRSSGSRRQTPSTSNRRRSTHPVQPNDSISQVGVEGRLGKLETALERVLHALERQDRTPATKIGGGTRFEDDLEDEREFEEERREERREEGLGGNPMRGPYGRFPLSLEEQFSYLEKTDLDAALQGEFNPNRLHRLLHPQSPWFVASAHEDESVTTMGANGWTTKSNASMNDAMFKRLCKGLSTPVHFLVAWHTLTVIMTWNSDPAGAKHIVRAMDWYGNHLCELSSNYTWESCLRVFIDHAKPRLMGKFAVSHWFEAANASQQQKLLIAKPAAGAKSVSFANGTSNNAVSSSSDASRKAICLNFNDANKGCAYAKCKRMHVCSKCKKGKHGAFDCPS